MQRRPDRRPQHGRHAHGGARIGVQAREVAARVKARQPAVDLGEPRRHVDVAVGLAHDPCNRAHRRKAVIEHARRRSGAVSRPPRPGPATARTGQPSQRRRPAAGRRSGRDWTELSSVAEGADLTIGGGGPSGPLLPPVPPRPASNVPESASRHARGSALRRTAPDSEPSLRRTTRGGKLRTGLSSAHGYTPCARRED